MSRRSYSGSAQATTLAAPIGSGDTSLTLTSSTNLPTTAFVLTLDAGGVEEKVLVGSRTGTTMNGVTRGYDGTTAQPHSAGVSVRHTISAVDLDEANAHVNATTGVHGVAGVLVGTTDTQTLTNKSLSGASNTFSAIPKASVTGAPSGAFVGTTDAQVLTNKTISGTSNTLSNIPQAAVTGAPTSAFVGVDDTQTLTNKTLTSPTINGVTVTGAVSLPADSLEIADTAGLQTALDAVNNSAVKAVNGSSTPRITSGSFTITFSAGLASGTVTFPAAFGTAPTVVVSCTSITGNTATVVNNSSVSTTSFTYRAYPAAGGSYSGTVTGYYIATSAT